MHIFKALNCFLKRLHQFKLPSAMYGNVCFHRILANTWLLSFRWDFYWGYVKSINQFRKNCLLYNIDSSLRGKWRASIWLHLYFISLSEVLLFSLYKSCTFIVGISSGCITVFVVVVSFCFVMWKPLKILSSFPKCVFKALEPPDALWKQRGSEFTFAWERLLPSLGNSHDLFMRAWGVLL